MHHLQRSEKMLGQTSSSCQSFFCARKLRKLEEKDWLDCVGCAPGLAETRGPTRAHWLNSLGCDFYTARSRGASGRQAAENTEPHVAPGSDRAYQSLREP
jgi:hypothetical protein